jgi:D-glycero-D-manno-heptose 1,7-bisphosphate phosphatase
MSRRAVLLDKDGTLVHDVPYNVDPRRMTLTPGAGPALQSLAARGYALAVVTNQPGIALGRFDAAALQVVRARLQELLAPFRVRLDGFFFCPHAPAAGGCACRKPAPGLLRQAAAALDIDLAASWMVGDILHDIEAGRRAGCRTVLIDCGNETEWQLAPARMPHFAAADLAAAARTILAASNADADANTVPQ